MNLSEFKAWFEGFTENMKGAPNEKQWARIKERVSEITEEPAPWPIVIREYERIRPWWPRPYWAAECRQKIEEFASRGTADDFPRPDVKVWNAIGQADYTAN